MAHSIKHRVLEEFWDAARVRYKNFGAAPTNREYGDALYRGLLETGMSPKDAYRLADSARRQRVSFGHLDDDPVPNIPNAIPKAFMS